MITKKQRAAVIESLINGCSVVSSCEAAGITTPTFYAHRYSGKPEDVEWALACEEARESRIGIAEDALFANVIKGNVTAQIFFLCNRSKGKWTNNHHTQNTSTEKPSEYNIVITRKGRNAKDYSASNPEDNKSDDADNGS